jgi:hypothetical protein
VVEAVTDAYKGSFRPWEFNRVPFDYWQGEEGKKHAIEAVKWLVVEKLNLTKLAEVPSKLNKHVFNKYGLDGMLNIFNHSTYRAVDAAYPGRFKPWEFERVPINYWCGPDGKKHAEEAMKWLIEEKLKISVREIPGKVTSSCLKKYRLGSMLKFCYDDQIYNAIDSLYPGKFKLWEIKKVENRFWEGENGEAKVKEAMEWLLIEWFHSYPRPEDLPHKFTEKLFSKSRLRSLLQTRFHGSVQEAVDYAWKEFYPAYMMS